MKVFYSDNHFLHNPTYELAEGGVREEIHEKPIRALQILHALTKTDWAEIITPDTDGLESILEVHDVEYLSFIKNVYREWRELSLQTSNEDATFFPAIFPRQKWYKKPESFFGRMGYYISDLSAPIVSGTYDAALSSVYCAVSGAKEILKNSLPSFPYNTFALCRPPGHHAGRANCGGYCYINNASVAANILSKTGNVAILDIDYHAGNGTQDIFFRRSDVLTISIHANPNHEYPYFSGYADEIGENEGSGFHRNYPLDVGTSDNKYYKVLEDALTLINNYSPKYLVVSVGMDIYSEDPIGRFKISENGINQIGKRIADLHLPALIVMEGGYNTAQIGQNMIIFLENFI